MNQISSLLHLMILIWGFSKRPLFWRIKAPSPVLSFYAHFNDNGITKFVRLYGLFCASSPKLTRLKE
jgi:hypothetical protein